MENTVSMKEEKEKSMLTEQITYQIKGRSFVVEPVFKKESPDTLGSVLLRLMKSENEKP